MPSTDYGELTVSLHASSIDLRMVTNEVGGRSMQRSAVFAGRHGATEGLAGRTATAESADHLCALSAPGNVSKRSSSTFRPSSSSRTRDFRFILLNRAGVEFLDVYPIIGTTITM